MPKLGKEVIDQSYATGYATSPAQAPQSGGASIGKPFDASPFLPPDDYGVLDITSTAAGVSAPAALGKLLVLQTAAPPNVTLAVNNNTTGGAFFAQAQIPTQALPEPSRGIVNSVGQSQVLNYPIAGIVVRGAVSALCVAPQSGNGISVGSGIPGTTPTSLLCSDGNGNLQPLPLPSAAPTPTVTPTGGSGTTWTYALIAVSANGTYSALGATGTTASGVATMTTAAYNTISWTPVADAVGYIVVRTVAGTSPNTVGVIAYVPAGTHTLLDNGLTILTGTSATVFFQQPASPTPTVANASGTGSTTWTYTLTAVMPNNVAGVQSSTGSNASGPATLTSVNSQKITWTNTAGAIAYLVNRTVAGTSPSSTGFIGIAYPSQATSGFFDVGQAAISFPTLSVTPAPTPQASVVVATALAALAASTTTPTLTAVNMGNV